MLSLAVATSAETYDRMRDPLAERGIEIEYVDTSERTVALRNEHQEAAYPDVEVGFVFPPRLAEGGVADALLDVPWVNNREAVLRSRHKGEALARLKAAGVDIPESVVVSNPIDEEDLQEVFEQFETPVIVKPNATTRGVGVAKAGDLDTFLGICDYLDLVHDYRATGDQSFLVQEFLANARDYRAMVIDGEFAGAVERKLPAAERAQGRWKHNVHRGAEATGVDLPDDLRAIAEAAAEGLSIPWLGVDILVTEDRAVVNETNARPTIDTSVSYEPGFWDDLAALVRGQV
jgi:ribosomal protein S6--L-glutamate ligase